MKPCCNMALRENFGLALGLSCPSCGQWQRRMLIEMSANPLFACINCGTTLRVGREQVNGVLEAFKQLRGDS